MNPTAQPFQPPSKPGAGANAGTKLRATAPSFQPGGSSGGKTPMSPASPAAAAVVAPAATAGVVGGKAARPPPNYSQAVSGSVATAAPAAAAAAANAGDDSPVKALSPNAVPYTPTRQRKEQQSFPTSPAPQAATATAAAAAARHVDPLSSAADATTNAAEADAAAASAPASPTASADPWAKLKLLASVEQKPAPTSTEALKLNTTWSLYADDHPSAGGALSASGSAANPAAAATAAGGAAGAGGLGLGLLAPTGPVGFAPVAIKTEVGDLATFWRLWRHVPPPSALTPSFTYQWFRKDIKPSWEEPRNKDGGTITIVAWDRDRAGIQSREVLDEAFLLAVLGITGESLAGAAVVNGVVMKLRKTGSLQFWTASSEEAKIRALAGGIRATLSRALPARQLEKIEYFSHATAQQNSKGGAAGAASAGAASGGGAKGKGGKPAPKAARTAVEADFTFTA